MYCRKCKTHFTEDTTTCPICGAEADNGESDWIILGYIEDKLSADFASETLKNYGIPITIISKSGFFGDIGLPLASIFSPKEASFEVSVPSQCAEEAADILEMTIGERWHPITETEE